MIVGALPPGRLAAIPSEFSGRARLVHCPSCRAELMVVMDEDGRGTRPLEVGGYDLADGSRPGHWIIKGGLILASPHDCRNLS